MDSLLHLNLRNDYTIMYLPVLESPVKRIVSIIGHWITDVLTPTIQIVGPIVVGVVIVGVVIVAILIIYKILSIQGHQLEKPDPLE